ncbi:MAG TPA: anaerobic sulfatase maturase, partial [Spirochaetia bacterium]|nr:anaerobic sulfatase maturase [Spirochaetia bacterium]
NLECDYCFYLEKKALYPETRRHQMSDSVLESLVAGFLATPQPAYTFGWQGGEPTLMGRTFFKRVTELQEHYGRRGAIVSNGLQTNGTMITPELASHLSRYRFLVGLSIDGPEEVHNVNRRRPSGRGSYADTIRAVELFRSHRVEFNVLTVVSSASVEHPEALYDHFDSLGIAYQQYIPCVEFDADNNPRPFTITGRQWGEFLIGLFDRWIAGDTERVSIRNFDSVLTMLVANQPATCTLSRNCNQYFVVEWNGDIYPCDFFVDREKLLGNLLEQSWEELSASPIYREFGRRKVQWSNECARCPYLRLCAGDCPKMRYRFGENPSSLSWLCEGWKLFYDHALPELKKLAKKVRGRRLAAARSAPLPTVRDR